MRLLHACPPSCKHLPVDLTESKTRPRAPARPQDDRMAAGGKRRRDLSRRHAQRLALGLNRRPSELI